MKKKTAERYRDHTIQRFKERFNEYLSYKDYYKLCEQCKYFYIEEKIINRLTSLRTVKIKLGEKDFYINCIWRHRNDLIKTVYPIKKTLLKKIKTEELCQAYVEN